MRRLLVALTLVAMAAVPAPAVADAAPYSHPANAGLTHPFGAPLAVEASPIDIVAKHSFTQFTVEAHDWLGYYVWMKVCLRYSNVCVRTVEGDDRLVIDAAPGEAFPTGTVARIYVYTAHAWADGETSVATWGGVRAQFNPEAVTYDIVPYVASGYGGVALGFPINVRFVCGDLVSAQCVTAPVTARNLRITVVDAAAQRTYFEACTYQPNGEQIACNPATNVAFMPGISAGGKIDVRPYNMLGNELKGTKGYVLIQYILS